jgi:hypothetical protein
LVAKAKTSHHRWTIGVSDCAIAITRDDWEPRDFHASKALSRAVHRAFNAASG